MKLSRRDFMKANAAVAAAAAAGLTIPTVAQAVAGSADAIKWDKAPCRFCGTGCGVLYQVAGDRILATLPNRSYPVNQGGLCIKGWNCHEHVASEKRLTRPLLRQGGELTPCSWDQAVTFAARRLQVAGEAPQPLQFAAERIVGRRRVADAGLVEQGLQGFVAQVGGDADDIGKAHAGIIENGLECLETHFGLGRNVMRDSVIETNAELT